jgi:hypothetical protein
VVGLWLVRLLMCVWLFLLFITTLCVCVCVCVQSLSTFADHRARASSFPSVSKNQTTGPSATSSFGAPTSWCAPASLFGPSACMQALVVSMRGVHAAHPFRMHSSRHPPP